MRVYRLTEQSHHDIITGIYVLKFVSVVENTSGVFLGLRDYFPVVKNSIKELEQTLKDMWQALDYEETKND